MFNKTNNFTYRKSLLEITHDIGTVELLVFVYKVRNATEKTSKVLLPSLSLNIAKKTIKKSIKMAFIKEVILAALFTAFALAQLPPVEVPALPVNQTVPALPETPAGNNTQVPATPEVPNTNGTVPEVPNTNGTVPIDTGMATVPPVPGQGGSTTQAPNRLMNAINGIRGNRG